MTYVKKVHHCRKRGESMKKSIEEFKSSIDDLFALASEKNEVIHIADGKEELLLINSKVLNEKIRDIVAESMIEEAERSEDAGAAPISFEEFRRMSDEMKKNARSQNRISS